MKGAAAIAGMCFLFLLMAKGTLASHALGGEITYTHIQGLTYQINVTFYTHIPTAQNGYVDRPVLDSVHLGEGVVYSFVRDTFVDYPNDIRVNYYSANYTYAGPGIYHIYFVDPNRIGNVANIPNSFYTPFAIESELIISAFCPNSSVTFGDKPIFFAQHNKPYSQNVTAINIDHDSISFELVPCLGENLAPIPGYTFPENFRIDSISGLISSIGAPDTVCEWAFAIKISDWKNGVLAGYVIRDYVLEVLPDTDTVYFFSPPGNSFSLNDSVGSPINSSFYYLDNSGAGVSVYGEACSSNDSATTIFMNGVADTIFQSTTWTPDFFRPRPSPYIFVYRGGAGTRQTDFTVLVYVTGAKYDSCFSSPTIGVQEYLQNENALNFYPNPSDDQLHFLIGKMESENCKISIYNMLGDKVLQGSTYGTHFSISVKSLPNGIYLFQVANGKKEFARKFCVRHR